MMIAPKMAEAKIGRKVDETGDLRLTCRYLFLGSRSKVADTDSMASPSLTGKVLKNKWRLGALVGEGACADVYEATDISAGAVTGPGQFVAKIAPLPVDLPSRPKRQIKEEKLNADLLFKERTFYQGYLLPLRDIGCVVEVSVRLGCGQRLTH